MVFLDPPHNLLLVFASLCVAMIAGFTGLSLTQGLSHKSLVQRKVSVALAAIALGGGIWSMHFVAMLGMQLPIQFYYDAAITLASALVAILVVGLALLILHFRTRTNLTLTLAGGIVGLGILAMHYIGMAGLELCRAVYTPLGLGVASVSSCLLSIAAFRVAYGNRRHRNILLGTLCFGFSVFAVHFVAVAGTDFIATATQTEVGPLIGNEVLAIGVVLTSFVLCSAFLLTGVTFLGGDRPAAVTADTAPSPALDTSVKQMPDAAPLPPKIPYEHDGGTRFLDLSSVVAIRAEGHYTHVYTDTGKFFCAWSITEAEKRLSQTPLLKSHRSYLINPAHVSRFERLKDNGVCHFDLPHLPKVPISRTRLKPVREALGV